VLELPHTIQAFPVEVRSGSTDFFAISIISGEMIGSAIGFFFMFAFTIVQIIPRQTGFGSKDSKKYQVHAVAVLYPLYLTPSLLGGLLKKGEVS